MKGAMLLSILALILFSCRGRHKVEIQINDQVNNVDHTGEDVDISLSDFEWFDGKFNAEVNNNGKVNTFKGRVRMRRDSLMWISIKPDVAIIEVFRILINPDSVKFVNYLDKEYMLEDFSLLSDIVQYDISFDMLQGIFIGNPHFMFSRNQYQVSVSEKDTLLSSSDMKTYLESRQNPSGAKFLFQALYINPQHKAWRSIVYDPKSRMEMDVQYPAYQTIDSVLYPLNAQLSIVGDTVNTRFGFDYTKTLVNQPFDFPFNIPSSYKQVTLKKP